MVCASLHLFSLLTWKPDQQRHPSESQSHRSSDIVEHAPLRDEASC